MKFDWRFLRGLRWCLAGTLCWTATSQVPNPSASDLIGRIARISAQQDQSVFSCGETEEDREEAATARLLTSMGASVLPKLEEVLASVQKQGRQSEFASSADLLLRTYAQIKGPSAYPLERSMLDDRKLAYLESAVDVTIALSFGLTSYRSLRSWTPGVGPKPYGICGPAEPWVALSQLIDAWVGNSRPLLEASLGPAARAALRSLLARRTWAELRAGRWRNSPMRSVGIGYRFGFKGEAQEKPTPPQADLETIFTDSAGGECGRHRIRFLQDKTTWRCMVDDSDLLGLLDLISACAATI
jgi:hypothetical protein